MGAPTKSITCFKDLKGFADDFYPRNPSEIEAKLGAGANWLTLLSTEVAKRVEDDEVRNKRHPNTLAILYGTKGQPSKSRRQRFPTSKGSALAKAIEKTLVSVLKSSDVWPLVKLGVVAEDFKERGNIAAAFEVAGGTQGSTKSHFTTTKVAKKKKDNGGGIAQTLATTKGGGASSMFKTTNVKRGGEKRKVKGGGGNLKNSVKMSDEEVRLDEERRLERTDSKRIAAFLYGNQHSTRRFAPPLTPLFQPFSRCSWRGSCREHLTRRRRLS